MRWLTTLDLAQNELQNAQIQNLGANPASPVAGQVYFNTVINAIRIYDGTQWNTLGIGDGSVTSVALSLPSIFTVTGSPVTTTGTLTGTLAPQSQDTVFAAPSGVNGAPTFRLLVPNDIPTLLSTKISDFDTQVRTSRLDQMTVPTASVSMNSQRLTNLADPVAAQDAATRAYVDAVKQGLDIKDSVRATSTANITLSGTQTVDGVALVVGDRFLAKDQTTASQNGIYVVAAGAWARSADADSNVTTTKVSTGMYAFVEEGTANADSGWVLTTTGTIVVGTTALTFAQFSGAGQITAGAGLTKTGNTIDAVGTANRILVNADNIDIAATYVGQTSITTVGTIAVGTWAGTTIAVANGGTGATTAAGAKTNLGFMTRFAVDVGDGSTKTYVVTHNMNTRDITIQIRSNTSPWDFVQATMEATTVNTATVRFGNGPAPSVNEFRVLITG